MADNSGIKIFEHNETAYTSAIKMLNKTGKAAIIHPTGTGKSFIAFKLCEDNINKRICWLSPSEYIFKTQCENLEAVGSAVPDNIAFFTYAKLMLMSDSELEEIKPDYIILDEFHRCGAEMWGKGVENLLNKYPDIPVLGLSATAIRYLDNRRDMSDELFDGNIASEMTLGQAIVRGILNSPKYVTALYSYQKDFEKYEYRVKHAQSKIVRDAGEKYLEALKRAIEKAEGLDLIFGKHITDKSGKYIVFCANKEHMDEMISNVPNWFSEIDKNPEIYSAYSNNPETSIAFDNFKKSESKHLKLLFCIDMLNEGVHVDGISGVIMFRPTVSPIIYKQQIGRALCTGSNKNAVILDIVDNISGLYSVGAIEEEIKDAVDFYNYRGESSYIVNDKFKIIDELAKEYYQKYGNLNVNIKYATEDGVKLGIWISSQRYAYNKNKLSEDRIHRLESIGMSWQRDISRCEEGYLHAADYFEVNQSLNPSVGYTSDDGFPLGVWVSAQRRKYQSGKLSDERINRLEKLKIDWNPIEALWQEGYANALEYRKIHGNLYVNSSYITDDGYKLGAWLNNQRTKYRTGKLSYEHIELLNKIDMVWSKNESKWYQGYSYASKYFTKNNNLNIPQDYVTDDGYKLGEWLGSQRRQCRNGKLDVERQERLENIGAYFQ